ncbi:MAG: stage 0 sporulation family protein [Clostridia bacterium]|nr:stage 0 sporulation family protein [Clostridia bacterium]
MKRVAGVRFKRTGKIYFFDPQDLELQRGMNVIVDTANGDEYGEIAIPFKDVEDSEVQEPLRKVIRIVTEKDRKSYEENKAKEPEARKIFEEKVKNHDLKMKLIDVEYKFDGSKVVFYFTADGRIDFRELVKDLAAVFRTRIELRQIGVRDEVRRLGGCGMCGRPLCCTTFLGNFETVSIKMAKDQNISLNPTKISGCCGRLMCCLKYEECVYAEKLKRLPKIGAIVKTEDGTGEVVSVETLKERVRVKFRENDDTFFKKYEAKDVTVIKDVAGSDDVGRGDVENEADLKELQELEKLEKADLKNNNDI